jgi:hypothetical protein
VEGFQPIRDRNCVEIPLQDVVAPGRRSTTDALDDRSSVTGRCLRAFPLDACLGEQVHDDDGADRSD